jgi:nucleotide-binding universal stress UspA family protein
MKSLELERIVVGVDGSPAAADALEWAVGEARLTGAKVDAVYAWDPSPIVAAGAPRADWRPLRHAAERRAAEFVRGVLGRDGDVPVTPRMAIGRPAEVLVAASAGADLLVVGSRGISGLEAIEAGSISHHCVAYAECPVVIVRHDPLRRGEARPEETPALAAFDRAG